jgi:hypothetical protein
MPTNTVSSNERRVTIDPEIDLIRVRCRSTRAALEATS